MTDWLTMPDCGVLAKLIIFFIWIICTTESHIREISNVCGLGHINMSSSAISPLRSCGSNVHCSVYYATCNRGMVMDTLCVHSMIVIPSSTQVLYIQQKEQCNTFNDFFSKTNVNKKANSTMYEPNAPFLFLLLKTHSQLHPYNTR